MSDICLKLTELLAMSGEELGVYTDEFISPKQEPIYVNVGIVSKGDLIGFLRVIDRAPLEEYNAAVQKLPTVIAQAGFTPVRETATFGRSVSYLKPDDPRRAWGIVGLDSDQIKQVVEHLQDPRFQSATVGFNYSGMFNNMSVRAYELICKGPDAKISLALTRKSGGPIGDDLHSLFEKYGWVKKSSYVDPRGGIEGDTVYVRS